MNLLKDETLAVFDLESTGLDKAQDRIIEISILKIYPNGTQEILTQRFNPDVPIKPDAFEAHKISMDDLKDQPSWKEKAQEIREFFGNSALAGFNLKFFDIPLLREEFLRADIDYPKKDTKIIDAGVIFKKKEQRTLSAALQFYCSKEHEGAHGAEADTIATFEVLDAQIDKYSDIGSNIDDLVNFSKYDDENEIVDFDRKLKMTKEGIIVYGFGKHKGLPVNDHPDYAEWMIGQDWVTLDTKQKLREIIYGDYYLIEQQNEEENKKNNTKAAEDDELPF